MNGAAPRYSAVKKYLRTSLFVFLLGLVIIGWASLQKGTEPSWHGKSLRQWMRGHPLEYGPAVQAMGSNAMPFLLSELVCEDSGISKALAKPFLWLLDSGPPWETARTRQYHARLALQILDTNAVPALLHAFFQEPFRVNESSLPCAVGWIFACLPSTGCATVHQALNEALHSPELQTRRNACLAFYGGLRCTDSELNQLLARTRDTEPLLRAAATRALIMWQTNESEVISALAARLDDPQAAIRRLAAEALSGRTTNAVPALPALQAAYSNELTRASLRDDVDDLFRGQTLLSPQNTQASILYAIQRIAPGSPAPLSPTQ